MSIFVLWYLMENDTATCPLPDIEVFLNENLAEIRQTDLKDNLEYLDSDIVTFEVEVKKIV